MTKNQIVSDIILRLTRGKPSDDLELEPQQVAHWVDLVLPGLVKKTLDEKILAGRPIEAGYIKHEECSELLLRDKNCTDCLDNIYYVIKCEPINLVRDRGIVRVATSDGTAVDKVFISEVDNIMSMTWTRPSLDHLVYYREGCNIYILGLTKNTMHLADFDIWYVPKPAVLEELEDDDELFIGDDLLAPLADEVEKIGRRQLYQSGEDIENDGQQDLKQQPGGKQ
jgi:hypothetical protein